MRWSNPSLESYRLDSGGVRGRCCCCWWWWWWWWSLLFDERGVRRLPRLRLRCRFVKTCAFDDVLLCIMCPWFSTPTPLFIIADSSDWWPLPRLRGRRADLLCCCCCIMSWDWIGERCWCCMMCCWCSIIFYIWLAPLHLFLALPLSNTHSMHSFEIPLRREAYCMNVLWWIALLLYYYNFRIIWLYHCC